MKNGCFSLILCVLILFFSDFSSCFTSNNMGKKLLGNSKLYLFDFFKPKNIAAPVNGMSLLNAFSCLFVFLLFICLFIYQVISLLGVRVHLQLLKQQAHWRTRIIIN